MTSLRRNPSKDGTVKPNIRVGAIAMAIMVAFAGPAASGPGMTREMTREQGNAEPTEVNGTGDLGATRKDLAPGYPIESAASPCADAADLCGVDGTSMLFSPATEID
jgi:hypothetical protein